jgi:hypothetical protein
MISHLKKFCINIFLKFLAQEGISKHIQQIAQQSALSLPKIQNETSPYTITPQVNTSNIALREDIVFITSRFRSGSTLLWNLFRQTGVCTSYYEPFNERQWFNQTLRGSGVDDSHRGVNDYWAEYNDLAQLSKWYDEDWIRSNLLMNEWSWMPKMKAYIEELVNNASHRPVLQFNRIDFRLPWIKHHFPNAKILHLYRNPRDQWCSFLRDLQKMNKNDVHMTYEDNFYLDIWCKDLARHYPVLDINHTPHPYQRFYYLWKLSYLHGRHFSDHSLSFEELTEQPQDKIKTLFELLNIKCDDIQNLSSIIQAPEPNRWRKYADESWFKQHEEHCEQNLSLMLNKFSPTREQ